MLIPAATPMVPRLPATRLASLVTMIAGLAMSACVATGNADLRAPEWLAIDTAPAPGGCPSVAGRYENRASAAYPGDTTTATLTGIFSAMARGVAAREPGRYWSIPGEATHVSIEQSPENLTLTFLGLDGERTTQSFHRLRIFRSDRRLDETFSCNSSKGVARLSFPMATVEHRTDSAAPLYGGASDVYVQFFKARDGALIMRTVRDKVGLSAVIIGSHFSRESSWHRFAETEEPMQLAAPQRPEPGDDPSSY